MKYMIGEESSNKFVIYFLQVETGEVKIGIAREHKLKRRIADLQIGNHQELKLLRTVKGSIYAEFWLHRKFRKLHIRGEWFKYTEDMMKIVPPLDGPSLRLTHSQLQSFLEMEKIHQ